MATNDYQIWVAQEFAKLMTIASEGGPIGKENIGKVLAHYAESCSEGNRRALAEIAGCRRSSFHNWCRGATTGRISPLLRTCYELEIPFTSLITGTSNGLEDAVAAKASEATRRRGVMRLRSADRIGAVLLAATKEQPAPSIGEIARRLGYSTPTRLYAADSDLCKMIVRNFNRSGRNHWWRRRGAKIPDDSIIRKTLEESLSLEIPIAVHRSAQSLGFQTADPVTRRFPDLCRAIKRKRAEVWAARRNALPGALEAALGENPPRSLEQIAERLGYSSRTSMHEREPELSAKLVARRCEFVKCSRKPEPTA